MGKEGLNSWSNRGQRGRGSLASNADDLASHFLGKREATKN